MTRKEFLEKLPIGAAFAFTAICGGGCIKKTLDEAVRETTSLPTDTIPDPYAVKVDFTIDISTPEYNALQKPAGYAYHGDVIIAQTEGGEFVAATKICSDEYLPEIIWENGEYLCLEHGATFDVSGAGTTTYNDLGRRGIQVYNIEKNGNIIRVFS